MNSKNPYEDIIDMPHHVSERHAQMSAIDRAAQFSPFAALTGHGDAINETARLTTSRIEPDEDAKALLDTKLRLLTEMIESKPGVTVTYFVEDRTKIGGEYVKARGRLTSVNEGRRTILLDSGERIELDSILDIESDLLLGVIN